MIKQPRICIGTSANIAIYWLQENGTEYKPTTVTENGEYTILWDMPIHTDYEIKANKPDIIVKDKELKQCYLVDMTVLSEQNFAAKEVEKLSKYKDLEIEITRMWGMNTLTIPVVFGALGIIKKGLERYISKIPGKIDIREMQKIVLLVAAHILRKTLSIK